MMFAIVFSLIYMTWTTQASQICTPPTYQVHVYDLISNVATLAAIDGSKNWTAQVVNGVRTVVDLNKQVSYTINSDNSCTRVSSDFVSPDIKLDFCVPDTAKLVTSNISLGQGFNTLNVQTWEIPTNINLTVSMVFTQQSPVVPVFMSSPGKPSKTTTQVDLQGYSITETIVAPAIKTIFINPSLSVDPKLFEVPDSCLN